MKYLLALCLALGAAGLPTTASAADSPTPGRLLLVLDASGSMAEKTADGTKRIDAAKDALRRVVDELPKTQQVGLRVYGATVFSRDDEGACTDSQLVVEPGVDNRADLRTAIDAYKPYGETPIGHALQEAGKDLGTEGQRSIVLVSDGEPTCAPDPCAVAKDLSKTGVDVRIDVVGLDVSGKARDKLRCIAEAGHGTYYDVDSADELVESLDVTATRASRPFDLTGEPVHGATDPADAPLVTTGQWLDTFPADGADLWYRVKRTAPWSTIHVGATHFSTATGNFGQSVSVKTFHDPTSQECGSGASFARGSLGYGGASTSWRNDEDCATAETIFVKIHPLLGPEKLAGRPVEIAVYEEPPLADPSTVGLEASPTESPWVPIEPKAPVEDVVPGSSASNAPIVRDGTYAFDINPGETQAVAVPLDWGQDLQAQLDATVTRASYTDHEAPDIQLTGPLRADVGGDYTDLPLSQDWTSFSALKPDQKQHYRWGRQAFTVAYDHRFEIEDWWTGSALAGLRYVLISLPEKAAAPVSYTLTLKTNGTAGEGAPEYAEVDGLLPPAPDSRLVDTAGATAPKPTDEPATSAAKESDGSGFPWLVVALPVAAIALAAAGLAAVRRRRT